MINTAVISAYLQTGYKIDRTTVMFGKKYVWLKKAEDYILLRCDDE